MAPSAGGKNIQAGGELNEINYSWNQQNGKENQRPPVYYPEDYIISLKKYSKCGSNNANTKSIYDTTEEAKNEKNSEATKSQTLPLSKHSEYRSPIIAPPDTDCEMSLRQFGSITDLLTKLRADLKASFPSFVQEFVQSPMDGVSLLLEVLRAIQLCQNTITGSSTLNLQNSERNNQTYQRRAMLDELTCLQCLNLCCSRSPEAATRLGSTPVGLLPLACSSIGTGIRSRILALQLLTAACDKTALADSSQKAMAHGHTAVSDALSTLRLRCAEPVRFRLLVGMLNSGGGSGELQAAGLRFANTLLESAENTQNRLYLQAELSQAGLDPHQLTKLISSTSPWLDKLHAEIKRWDSNKIDVEYLQKQVRNAEQIRSKMVLLERKVEQLQEEKTVFTSIERRLQEKCAELQRELQQLKNKQNDNRNDSTLERRPVALPRQIPPNDKKKNPSENEDEGISSSETGPSMSPEPPKDYDNKHIRKNSFNTLDDGDFNDTIDDVIEELTNIVNDAEREIIENDGKAMKRGNLSRSEEILGTTKENEIVPVNLQPQPPKKNTKSLIQVFSPSSDAYGSDYDIYYEQSNVKNSLFSEDNHANVPDKETAKRNHTITKFYGNESETQNHPDIIHTACHKSRQHQQQVQKDDNRAILNVIMDAREKEQNSIMKRAQSLERDVMQPQQFNGVFFMTDMMNTNSKFPKPDITAALEAKRVTKNLDRMSSSYGLDSMIDIVMTSEQAKNQQLFIGGRESRVAPKIAENLNYQRFSASNLSNFKFKSGYLNAGLYSGQHMTRENSRSHSNVGSKVTDLISGLY